MLLFISKAQHSAPIFIVKLKLPVHFSHLIPSLIVGNSIDELIASGIIGEMFSANDADLVSVFVELLMVALLVNLDPVAMLVIFDRVVLLVVLDQVAMVVVLLGLPFAFGWLLKHLLLSFRFLELEILLIPLARTLCYFLDLIPFLGFQARFVDVGFEVGLGAVVGLAGGVLESRLEFVAGGGEGDIAVVVCLVLLQVDDVAAGTFVRPDLPQLLKLNLILLINLPLQILGLMLIDEVVVRVPQIHDEQEQHDASHHQHIKSDEELLVLADRVIEG